MCLRRTKSTLFPYTTLFRSSLMPLIVGLAPLLLAKSFTKEEAKAILKAAEEIRSLEKAEISVDLRSEEHTSELQSRLHLVCRLLLEKKNNNINPSYIYN